ncbi:mediator of RNA polymerase II transcription subunit 13 [Pseudocyphellaria aurata]|nr:mediator of RNA polymerase II transcription subunit 13 [Pseudocyphellaria aurata]
MEFPENALTNVYKAEAIHSIRWTLYTPADSNVSASTEEAQARRWIIDSSDGPSFAQVRKVRGLEYELRSKDYHVLYDADRAGVWLFDLPVPGLKPSQRGTESEMIAQIVAKFAMKKSSFGCLKASDTRSHSGIETPNVRTAKSMGSLRPGQSDIEKLNARNFSTNLASSRIFELDDAVKSKGLLEVPSGSFSVSMITTNLMAAISMSLVNSLISRQDLSPIGSRSCIGSLFPRDMTSPKINSRLDQPQMGMSLTSILVRWSCSGILTISIFQTVIPWLRRLSEMPTHNLQSSSSPLTRKVLISPSGMVVQYSRDLEMPTSSYRQQDHLDEVKKSIAKHLALQGIHVDHEEKWLQLQHITNHSAVERSKESPRQHLHTSSFLWPAKLCFYDVGSANHGEFPNYDRIKKDTEHDPLVDAESWFKSKAKREKEVEAKREDDERSAQRLQEAQEVCLDENLSDFIPRTNQYLSMQDASGIYPTPPDGLRSQALGPAVNTDAQVIVGEFAEKELTDKGEGNGMPAGSPFGDALNPDVTSPRYEEPDDGDLFGDMNSSLFAANGLTEADFSFFDEPRIDDELELPLDMERTSAEVASREVPDLNLISDPFELDEGFAGKKSDIARRASFAHKESKAKPVNMDGVADDLKNSKSRRSISPYEGPLTPVVEPNGESTPPQEERRVSFGSVLFREKLREFDDKYVTQGRFGYEIEALPSSSRLRRQQRIHERMIPRVGPADEEDLESYVTSETSPDEESDDTNDGTASDVSNPLHGDKMPKPVEDAETLVSRKRKRDHEEPIFHPVTPQLSDSSVAADDNSCEDNISYPAIDFFVRSSGTSVDESASFGLQTLDPNKSSSYGKHPVLRQANRTFMQVAQILVEQLILQTESSSEHLRFSEVFNYKAPGREHSLDRSVLRDIVMRFFPHSEQCTLGQYVNAERENFDLPISRQSQKEKAILSTPKGAGVSRNSLIKLQAPYTCVRRNQTMMDLLAPALHFWEELGLGPAHQSKDVTAVYMFSAGQHVQHGVEMFAKMMGNTYQSCKLGTHEEVSDSSDYLNGLVPVSMRGDYATSSIDEELRKSCEKLGTDLAKLKALGGYTVIYMIDPYEDSAALAHLCVAFLKLFESYVLTLKASSVENPNELVLQIIPTSFVASPTRLVLPSPADYKRLAFEVYDRCGPSVEPERSRFSCAPSVRLARAMPKTINLKLSPETSAGLLSSDMCFHLAYSWDPTQRWLTSSWTDNQGDLQWNAPYFLGVEKSDDPWPTLLNIAKEMLDTTLEMLDQQNSTWRLFIVKDSPIHKRELEIWLSLCAQHSQPRVTCTFLAIDSNPILRFPMSISSDKHTHHIYNTPSSTPAAAATYSPDPSALVSTPGGVNQLNPATPTTANPAVDPDPSAKLIDITDETWSLAFSKPLNNPLLPPHICRPVVSGYLLKRGGARDEDGLIPAQVDVVHAAEPKTGEALLEEVLAMYGALGTLARLRGIVHPVRCVLPWHVATARKANIGVNDMMEFGED